LLLKGGQKVAQKIGPVKLGALMGLGHGAGSTEPTEGNIWQKTGKIGKMCKASRK
jgi:hypothetical protein